MLGPRAASKSSGSTPASRAILTASVAIPASVPRHPAWTAAAQRERGATSSSGTQSAVRTPTTSPGCAETSASACAATRGNASLPPSTFRTGSREASTMRLPCTWRSRSRVPAGACSVRSPKPHTRPSISSHAAGRTFCDAAGTSDIVRRFGTGVTMRRIAVLASAAPAQPAPIAGRGLRDNVARWAAAEAAQGRSRAAGPVRIS